eukprot:TRINITY_DN21150_c0_g1_i1.p1 TRINITY_DN21150_c0_g1~~TRINITY_DN21150_c0_g1_i1.p1  ORF type:complete len:230 (+),score=35.09 TRINITY_DN21150_c0_g1_i1:237-926(+)
MRRGIVSKSNLTFVGERERPKKRRCSKQNNTNGFVKDCSGTRDSGVINLKTKMNLLSEVKNAETRRKQIFLTSAKQQAKEGCITPISKYLDKDEETKLEKPKTLKPLDEEVIYKDSQKVSFALEEKINQRPKKSNRLVLKKHIPNKESPLAGEDFYKRENEAARIIQRLYKKRKENKYKILVKKEDFDMFHKGIYQVFPDSVVFFILRGSTTKKSVSYTHLTLPTICSV